MTCKQEIKHLDTSNLLHSMTCSTVNVLHVFNDLETEMDDYINTIRDLDFKKICKSNIDIAKLQYEINGSKIIYLQSKYQDIKPAIKKILASTTIFELNCKGMNNQQFIVTLQNLYHLSTRACVVFYNIDSTSIKNQKIIARYIKTFLGKDIKPIIISENVQDTPLPAYNSSLSGRVAYINGI